MQYEIAMKYRVLKKHESQTPSAGFIRTTPYPVGQQIINWSPCCPRLVSYTVKTNAHIDNVVAKH